jgi:hypothetical protein
MKQESHLHYTTTEIGRNGRKGRYWGRSVGGTENGMFVGGRGLIPCKSCKNPFYSKDPFNTTTHERHNNLSMELLLSLGKFGV